MVFTTVTPRIIANRLLEADEDLDPLAEITRLTTSTHPGIEIESEGRHWNVYKKLEAATTPAFIGEITYDDMADMPKEIMTPEQITHWDTHRWYASAGFRDEEQKMCKSFDEALQWIVTVNAAKTAPTNAVMRRVKFTETLDPDDPELYLKPEQFTAQPGYEKIESDLRLMLRPYYPQVSINRRPAKHAEIFKGLRDYFTWTIHCKRETPLPLAKNHGYQRYNWRDEVERWFRDWAERNEIRLSGFAIYGRLRFDPTFQFTTWRLPPPDVSLATGQPILKENEADETGLTPEQIINDIVPKLDWAKQLDDALHQFHPYGVTYTVVDAPNLAFVMARTYFPPKKDNFAERLKNFVVNWLTEHRILVVRRVKLYTFPHAGASPQEVEHLKNYPVWTAGVSINSDWPPDDPAKMTSTVEVREP